MIENGCLYKEYELPPVNDREALRYAGATENDPQAMSLLAEAKAILLPSLRPIAVIRTVDASVTGTECNIGGLTAESSALAYAMRGCFKAVAFAATVGIGTDRIIAKYERISGALAHMISSLASERIEALCDEISKSISELAEASGCSAAKRFSAGYGDLAIEFQRELFSLLKPEKYIGLTLNSSLIMSPSKSVSAIIGIKRK